MNIVERKAVNGKPTWRLRWETRDPRPGNGGRRYIYETFHGPRREAERHWQRRWAEIEAQGAAYTKPDRQPLRDYLARWLDAADHYLRPTTAEKYRRAVDLHITPAIGAIALADVTPALAQKVFDDMRAGTGPEGREIGAPTVAGARRVLAVAMKEAVRLGLIPANPVARTRPPRQAHRHVDAFTVAEARALFKQAEGSRVGPLLEFAWLTAMRRGEVCALRWTDVDTEAATATVRRSLVKLGTGKVFQDPKTEAGIRTIVLPRQVLDVLKRQHAQQSKDRLRWGPRYHDSGLIFANRFGEALHPEDVSCRFRELRDKAGIRRLPFHALRHSGASVQIAAGVPLEIVSKRLGHRKVGTTADIYGHLLREADRDAAARVDAFLRQGKRKAR